MTFSSPVFLWLGGGLALLVLVSLWSHARRRRRLAEFLGGGRAVTRLSRSDLYGLRLERTLLLGLAALALGFAAAEPRWETAEAAPAPPPPIRSVVIAIDISASMQATDVAPTRLAQAVRIATDLLEPLAKDRVGLILVAGKSYVLAPPTHDHEALAYLLRGVTPTTASPADPGTLLSVGIRDAVALLPAEGQPAGAKAIVLIGDGEASDPEGAVTAAARSALAKGVHIHTIGVGTTLGAGMIVPDAPFRLGGQVLDSSGVSAISRLRAPLLRRLAAVGGGVYAHASDRAGLRALRTVFDAPGQPESGESGAAPFWASVDLAFWFALAALICLLMESLLDVRLPHAVVTYRRTV